MNSAEGNRVASHRSGFHVLAPANRLIEDEQFVYEYNPDGNLIRKSIKADGKEWRYGYDIYDRLISAGLYASAGASSPEKLKTYVYDAFDRRVSAFDETAGGLSSTTPARHTLHDEWNVLVQQESPQGSGGPASSQSRRWFTQGGEDDIAAITPSASGTLDPGSSSIYASTDHLGSVRALHDDNGTVVADLDHDTFGNREVAVESFAQPFGYTGREYDADTGLYHYRAREYDPVAGRFLQEDPIWYASGDMNVYRYVLSNPVRYRDPSGNAAVEYSCLTQFATGAGTAIGVNAGIGLAGVFYNISAQFAALNGDAARVAMLNGEMKAKQALLTQIGEEIAASLGACGAAKVQSCPAGGGGPAPASNSFAAGTTVLTRNGLKPIEAIEIGEEVAAWDQGNLKVLSTGEPDLKWRRVTGKFERQAPGVMHMTVRSGDVRETITVTPNHPYLRPSDVIGKGVLELVKMDPGGDWTAVLKLKPGDELVSALGVPLVVDSIDVDDGATRVYSLEVEGLHSFAVGQLAAWVHNAKPGKPKRDHQVAMELASRFLTAFASRCLNLTRARPAFTAVCKMTIIIWTT